MDWSTHFKQASQNAKRNNIALRGSLRSSTPSGITKRVMLAAPQVQFGTINGNHTVHELSDLLNTFTIEVNAMAEAYANGATAWQQNNPSGFAYWDANYQTFLSRYQPVADWTKARIAQSQGKSTSASQMFSTSGVFSALTGQASMKAWDIDTDEAAYQHLLSVFSPNDQDPTSFDNLNRSWIQDKSAPPPPNLPVHMPQPTAPDADLKAYQAADATLKAIVPGFGPPMPLWKKVMYGVGALLSLGLVIKVAK